MATGWLIYQSSMTALEQPTISKLFQPSSIEEICMGQTPPLNSSHGLTSLSSGILWSMWSLTTSWQHPMPPIIPNISSRMQFVLYFSHSYIVFYKPYQSFYHPYCPIQWGNTTSEQVCWLGDEKVSLPDIDTKNPTVITKYGEWIAALVKEYSIDGLRIDGMLVNLSHISAPLTFLVSC